MSASSNDRLYDLIPAIYRIRDSEIGEPLRALLSVVSTEVDVIERDIERLYDNWFIETCEEWTVPYIGDLVGHDPVVPSNGDVTDPHVQERNCWLFPRREIANIVRYRRRKGTLPVLEDLSRDIAGWPALAREARRQVAAMVDVRALTATVAPTGAAVQIASLPPGRRLPDLRRLPPGEIGGPFDSLPRLADLRDIGPPWRGLPHPRRVGLWVWQLPVYSMTGTAPGCRVCGDGGKALRYFTFHPLGIDTPLYNPPRPADPERDEDENPQPSDDPWIRVSELPLAIRRNMLPATGERGIDPAFYGVGRAFVICCWKPACEHPGGPDASAHDEPFVPIASQRVRVADLSDSELARLAQDESRRNAFWTASAPGEVERAFAAAVDPQTGRFLLRSADRPPKCADDPLADCVRVSFHYAFSADMGGGEYRRRLDPYRQSALWNVSPTEGPVRVSGACLPVRPPEEKAGEPKPSPLDRAMRTLEEHLKGLETLGSRASAAQRHVVLELSETGVYRLSRGVKLSIPADVTVEIRAGRRSRPVIRCAAQGECEPLPLRFILAEGARAVLDGLLIVTSGVCITQVPHAPGSDSPATPRASSCGTALDPGIPDPSGLTLRHSTIVSAAGCGCGTSDGSGAAKRVSCSLGELVVGDGVGELCLDHSIAGAIRAGCDCRTCEPTYPSPGGDQLVQPPPPALARQSCSQAPVRLTILDSIVAGAITGAEGEGNIAAVRDLRVERSTLLENVAVRQIDLISNSLLRKAVQVDRSAAGRIRYSYATAASDSTLPVRIQGMAGETNVLQDHDFESLAYGDPAFARLRRPRFGESALEPPSPLVLARTGADDGGEMGAFHDQFIPHRERSLERRLEEFTPATHGLVVEYISGTPP